jgi:hypothetical protein
MEFKDLIGKKMGFYGMDGTCFKLGSYVFAVEADEDDGYRSYLRSVEVIDPEDRNLAFSSLPLAYVKVHLADIIDTFTGYQLIDVEDKHIWAEIGTDRTDDYYPMFICTSHPKGM